MARWVFEVMIVARQVRHLDAISIQAVVVDQPFSQDQRLGWAVRFDIYLPLKAFEIMSIRIQQVLVDASFFLRGAMRRNPIELPSCLLKRPCLPGAGGYGARFVVRPKTPGRLDRSAAKALSTLFPG